MGASFRDFEEEGRKCIDHVFTNAQVVENSCNRLDWHREGDGLVVSDHLGLEFSIKSNKKEIEEF
jgi:endonuclease/exonuclease/phosphatase family metal-dependent hydrolase